MSELQVDCMHRCASKQANVQPLKWQPDSWCLENTKGQQNSIQYEQRDGYRTPGSREEGEGWHTVGWTLSLLMHNTTLQNSFNLLPNFKIQYFLHVTTRVASTPPCLALLCISLTTSFTIGCLVGNNTGCFSVVVKVGLLIRPCTWLLSR